MQTVTEFLGHTPQGLRKYLQEGEDRELRLRRGVVAVSLAGIGFMALTTLLQTGLVRTLPDPPIRGFRTKKVNSSDEAYSYGGPDSPIAIVAHGANMVLAATGGPDRPRNQPWIPIFAAGIAAAQAAVAFRYLFHQMPKVDRAWCPYCIGDALTHFATLGMTLPEAGRAVRALAAR